MPRQYADSRRPPPNIPCKGGDLPLRPIAPHSIHKIISGTPLKGAIDPIPIGPSPASRHLACVGGDILGNVKVSKIAGPKKKSKNNLVFKPGK